MLDTKIKFYKGRVALNVLAKDLENAKEIYEATEGHAVVGLLSKNYDKIEDGVKEVKEYLKELGVGKSGLERLIKCAYHKLGLMSFLTCGEIEVKAWTIKKASTAVEAAGEIHTDFMDKFIKAEVVSYEDFVDPDGCGAGRARNALACEAGGWKGARAQGKARLEGRDYVMQNGDVVEFKIGR